MSSTHNGIMELNTVRSFVWKLCSIRLWLFYVSPRLFLVLAFRFVLAHATDLRPITYPDSTFAGVKGRKAAHTARSRSIESVLSLWFISFLLAHLLTVIYFTWKILHLLRLIFGFYCTNVPWSNAGASTTARAPPKWMTTITMDDNRPINPLAVSIRSITILHV